MPRTTAAWHLLCEKLLADLGFSFLTFFWNTVGKKKKKEGKAQVRRNKINLVFERNAVVYFNLSERPFSDVQTAAPATPSQPSWSLGF